MLFIHEEQDLTLRVKSMTWEADGVLSIVMEHPDGADLPAWRPGAHLDLRLPGVITRQYSLSGDPAHRRTWRISVLRESESLGGSRAVHEKVRPGDLVEIRGPRNNFPLLDSPDYLFIAGGIGITPILPMVQAVAASGARWRLVYGGRSRSSMAFLDVVGRLGASVQIHPHDEFGPIELGTLLDAPQPDTLIYCCGPESLLAAVEEKTHTWPRGALHVERFKAKPREIDDPTAEIEFEVICRQSGTTVTVPIGKAILETLESAGIFPDNSCREGICGTCETVVISGLPDHRDSLLSDEEKEENHTMMICVGRARSPQIVLDL